MIKRSLDLSTDQALSKRPRLEIDNKVLASSFWWKHHMLYLFMAHSYCYKYLLRKIVFPIVCCSFSVFFQNNRVFQDRIFQNMDTISLFCHNIISFMKSTKNYSNTPITGMTILPFFNFVNLWNSKPHFSSFLDIFCPLIHCNFEWKKKKLSEVISRLFFWYHDFF